MNNISKNVFHDKLQKYNSENSENFLIKVKTISYTVGQTNMINKFTFLTVFWIWFLTYQSLQPEKNPCWHTVQIRIYTLKLKIKFLAITAPICTYCKILPCFFDEELMFFQKRSYAIPVRKYIIFQNKQVKTMEHKKTPPAPMVIFVFFSCFYAYLG